MNHEFPHSIDAERQVIATLVQHPEIEDVARTILRPESFFIPAHSYIYSSVLDLIDKHKPLGYAAVKEELVKRTQLQEAGGPEKLSSFWDITAPADSIAYYAQIVSQKALLRRAIIDARRIIEIAQDPTNEFENVHNSIESMLSALAGQRNGHEKSMRERTIEWLEGLTTRKERMQQTSFTFGVSRIDRNFGPMLPGEFVLIGAATSRGKSMAAFQGALHTAARGLGVAAFSLEMPDVQLWDRMFCHLSKISMNKFARGEFTQREFAAIQAQAEPFLKLPLHIEQRRGCTIADIASRLRRLKTKNDVKVAVVDYLQRVHPSTSRKDGPRYLEVDEVANRLKSLALELEIVVVAPVQLNAVGGTRESASCEMEADFHFKIVDDPGTNDHEAAKNRQRGYVLFQGAKQRQAPNDLEIPLRLNGEFMTLEERLGCTS
jgi:replicative DNA helicase